MYATVPDIPRHEPEVLRARVRARSDRDPARVASTALRSIVVNGIPLASRARRADEFEVMAAMAASLPPEHAVGVASIRSDGRAGNAYEVRLSSWDPETAVAVGHLVQYACYESKGGHDGISLVPARRCDRGEFVALAPDWLDD